MIILISSYGNHSNRLFQMIHFEAYAKEKKRKMISLCFDDMCKYYGLIAHPILHKLLFFSFRVLRKLKLCTVIDFDSEEHFDEFSNKLDKENISFVQGWYFRREDLILKYRNFFTKKYSLNKKYYNNNLFVNKALNKCSDEVLVGIHIRRGDYSQWQGGKFYFSDEVYINYIEKVKNEISLNNLRAKIIIFTNGEINIQENESLFISHEEWFIDQYLMSKCDYLMGPPSTFTLWASYIGNVPLMFIESSEMNIKLNNFHSYC